MWDYLDPELDQSRMTSIDAHLARCEYCHEHLRFEGWLIDRVRRLSADPLDTDALTWRVMSALARFGHSSSHPRDHVDRAVDLNAALPHLRE
jgi:hypothetical protein